MSQSLMQQVLGEQWAQLPTVIQRHYQIADEQISQLQGTMEITYPAYVLPLVWLIHMFGGLVLWRDKAVAVAVNKFAAADGILHWRRTLSYADGKVDYFRSQMQYVAAHELDELIGFGFGLRLGVEVMDGDLLYRSNGHFWQSGRLRVELPDWLLLGTAVIREHALSAESFYLDFSIRHPFLGLTYCYQGEFRYR
jgi:hypothetical protein